MTYLEKHNMPSPSILSPNLQNMRTVKQFPQQIFNPIDAHKYYPNRKYIIADDQFNKANGPILRFYAQMDDRGEYPRDQMKFRNCDILYFVADGKIKVYEAHQRNAGFPQGVLINKNHIPKEEGGFYCLEDFNIGKSVTLFGKKFKILDCDGFTKNYLLEMGYRMGTPEPAVIDPVFADRQEMDKHRTHILKFKQNKQIKPFFKSHPKQLHFYIIYNTRPSHFVEICYASMYYDITNNTIKIIDEKKILEYKRQLSFGNYDTYYILKPMKVPKKPIPINPVGKESSPVILNLNAMTRYMGLQSLMNPQAGGANNQIGFLRDSNPDIYANEAEYYTAEDFDLGKTINIFGFGVYIYDCDEFTKEFYRNEFNKELTPVPLPDMKEIRYPIPVHKENFGNGEDSLQTCKKLPSLNTSKELVQLYDNSGKISHKGSQSENLLKYFLNCRFGNDGHILTFLTRVITGDVFLKDQYFIIRWYLEDDTMDIIGLDLNFTTKESTQAMYMSRQKLTKPHSEHENAGTCYYAPKDMFVGNVIYAMKKGFLLVDADEYTYDYMERHCDTFIHSNVKHVMRDFFPLIRPYACDLKHAFENKDSQNTGFVLYRHFKDILMEHIKQDIKHLFPEHQIKTLARHFADENYVGLRIEKLISKIQMDLKRNRFQDFEKLKTLFHVFDMDNEENKGHFTPARVYTILRSYPLTIDRDLLKAFAYKFPQCNGYISYEDVVKSLNYFDNPIEPPDLTPYALNLNWERRETKKNMNKISYTSFLKTLTEEACPNCK